MITPDEREPGDPSSLHGDDPQDPLGHGHLVADVGDPSERSEHESAGRVVIPLRYGEVEALVDLRGRGRAIHLLYWTAWADGDGTIQFRRDLHDRDAPLRQALRAPPPAEE